MQHLTLSVGSDTYPAVFAAPDGAGPFPGVVVIHDITGFRDDTVRHCERFAAAGYAAIAPDLMQSLRCVVRTLATAAGRSKHGHVGVEAARAWLAEHPDVDATRIGVTGFCMGGGFAIIAAADNAYAVTAPFYGTVPRKASRLQSICPTLAQFGAQDLLFRGQASRLSSHLKKLGVTHEVLLHEGVGHSFMNDHPDFLFRLGRFTPLRARYDAEIEALAWNKLLAFFAEHMPAPPATLGA